MVTLMPQEQSSSLSSVAWLWPCPFSFWFLCARLGDILERSIKFPNSNAMGVRTAAVRIGVRAALLLRWQDIPVIMPHMVRDGAVRRGCLLAILPLYNFLGVLIILCSSNQTSSTGENNYFIFVHSHLLPLSVFSWTCFYLNCCAESNA